MKIALGSDHHGVRIVRALTDFLKQQGHTVCVHGPPDGASCDYPVPAVLVGRDVAEGRSDAGVLVCGSGIGISIAANKVPGVRAALAGDDHAAEMSRRHNDANVICFSGSSTDPDQAISMVEVFLRTPFEGGRHARRVAQIAVIERGEIPDHCERTLSGE